jgi:hypothetical protein
MHGWVLCSGCWIEAMNGLQPDERRERRRRSPPVQTMHEGENIFFDSMMVDLVASGIDSRMELLLESEHVQCLLPFSVREEAPECLLQGIARFLHTVNMGPLTTPEHDDITRFRTQHQGRALPKNIHRDLSHVWESAKYGARFFVTHDKRLLKRKQAILAHKWIALVTLDEAVTLHNAMAAPIRTP